MGGTESHLDLIEYDINTTKDIGTFLFIGPQYQTALNEFLYLKKNIANAIAITTDKSLYKEKILDRFIYHEYTSELAYNIINLQLTKKEKIVPLLVIIHHHQQKIPIDKLYRTDNNFQQLIDYSDRLRVSLVLVSDIPINIKLRKKHRGHDPCFDYIFISSAAGLNERLDAKYVKKLFKYYFKRYMNEDESTFRDTFNYYLNSPSDKILLFHKEQELFYYKPLSISIPYKIAVMPEPLTDDTTTNNSFLTNEEELNNDINDDINENVNENVIEDINEELHI